jgi:hypothetical protein
METFCIRKELVEFERKDVWVDLDESKVKLFNSLTWDNHIMRLGATCRIKDVSISYENWMEDIKETIRNYESKKIADLSRDIFTGLFIENNDSNTYFNNKFVLRRDKFDEFHKEKICIHFISTRLKVYRSRKILWRYFKEKIWLNDGVLDIRLMEGLL